MVKGRERSRGKKKRELPPKEKAILKLNLRFIVIVVERSNDRMRSIVRSSCNVSGCIYLSFLVFVRKAFAFHSFLNIRHYSSSVGSNISP